jgi:hypothetical protein
MSRTLLRTGTATVPLSRHGDKYGTAHRLVDGLAEPISERLEFLGGQYQERFPTDSILLDALDQVGGQLG